MADDPTQHEPSLRLVPGLGPTGDYPDGQLDEHDRGGIRLAVVGDPARGLVTIDFGTPVRQVSMSPDDALEFMAAIMRQASYATRPAIQLPPESL